MELSPGLSRQGNRVEGEKGRGIIRKNHKAFGETQEKTAFSNPQNKGKSKAPVADYLNSARMLGLSAILRASLPQQARFMPAGPERDDPPETRYEVAN